MNHGAYCNKRHQFCLVKNIIFSLSSGHQCSQSVESSWLGWEPGWLWRCSETPAEWNLSCQLHCTLCHEWSSSVWWKCSSRFHRSLGKWDEWDQKMKNGIEFKATPEIRHLWRAPKIHHLNISRPLLKRLLATKQQQKCCVVESASASFTGFNYFFPSSDRRENAYLCTCIYAWFLQVVCKLTTFHLFL